MAKRETKPSFHIVDGRLTARTSPVEMQIGIKTVYVQIDPITGAHMPVRKPTNAEDTSLESIV